MPDDRTTQLAAALQRPPDDPLVAQLGALIRAVEAGAISAAGAEAQLARDPGLQPARGLLSFRDAEIDGGVSVGDVAGGNITKIAINLPSTTPPATDIAAAQALLERLPLDMVPEPAALPVGSRMPLRRNPLFVGRDENLRGIAAALKDGGAAVIATGIGGVGKTQLAAEFAHRYGQFFAGGVFWLSFADAAGIAAEIAACGGAGAMELYSDAVGLSQAEQVARVRQEWQGAIPRLLIFDNCDDAAATSAEALLAAQLPSGGGCRVLITSRRGQWRKGLGVAALPLAVLDRAASIALLRGHHAGLGAADASAIAETLGDLPLALSLAGSYLETYRDDSFGAPATYLAHLQKQLLDHRSLQGAGVAPSLTGHELNVRATFDLSYGRLQATDPVDALAIAALARAAHLAPGEPFPRDMLVATLGEATDDEEQAAQRADGVGRLVALGLLERAEGGALRIHRLIAVFARVAGTDGAALEAVEAVLRRRAYEANTADYPAPMQPILAHLRHATEAAFERADEQAARLCNNLGYYLRMIGDYAGAKPLLEQALAIHEEVLGPVHPDTARSLNNLAGLLESQGDYAAAKPLHERALAIREQVLGPVHPDTATSLNNLAALLYSQGGYAGAKPLLERALAIWEQALGPKHPDTAQSLNNLAGLLYSQGDYAAAKPLYERALAICEEVLGPLHPDTAQSLNNLALLLYSQGDYAAAKPLYERALAVREQVLGPLHPDTAISLNNLAGLLETQEDYAGAKPLYEQALAIWEQVLGPKHPDTASSLNNLAALLQAQGDLETARQYHERALSIREAALGPDHPDTAQSLWWLGTLLQQAGDRDGARAWLQRTAAIYIQVLGPAHPTTQQCQQQLDALDSPPPARE